VSLIQPAREVSPGAHNILDVPLSLKAINVELAKHGFNTKLTRGSGYFYVWSGEATDWLDRTIQVPTVSSLTLQQWIEEVRKLRETNRQLMRSVEKRPTKPAKKNPQKG
jgi:hypothetical protein